MNILYLDCGMGAAGDMLTAALLELHPDPEGFLARLNALLPDFVRVSAAPDSVMPTSTDFSLIRLRPSYSITW